jgi:hypothetical protein
MGAARGALFSWRGVNKVKLASTSRKWQQVLNYHNLRYHNQII